MRWSDKYFFGSMGVFSILFVANLFLKVCEPTHLQYAWVGALAPVAFYLWKADRLKAEEGTNG